MSALRSPSTSRPRPVSGGLLAAVVAVLLGSPAHGGETAKAAPAKAPTKSAASGAAPSAARLRFLEKEIEMACEPRAYFVLDLGARRLELRMAGLAVKAWDLPGLRFWGRPGGVETWKLASKSALNPPQRNIVQPGKTEVTATAPKPGSASTDVELDSLELRDMPTEFGLEFEGGRVVLVRAPSRGLRRVADEVLWHAWMPLQSLRAAAGGKPFVRLRLATASPDDARSIYWTFYDGIEGLVVFP